MISLQDAQEFVLSSCQTLPPVLTSLAEALGCVTATDLIAPESVPSFANSAMDGYALRADDCTETPVGLQVVGRSLAGDGADKAIGPGEALRIMTGAPMPDGADAVCMIEHVDVKEDGCVVSINRSVSSGTNVRQVGEDVEAGEIVFAQGTLLLPAHIGVLASLGICALHVHPLPRVGVLSTGDELVDASGCISAGKIRDANRPALVALVRQAGWSPVDLGIVPDKEPELQQALIDAAQECDAIVTSGGVSVGDRDALKAVLKSECGAASRSMQVAIKPAKPLAFGVLEATKTPVFGLPGNPVSALVAFELFVRPALRRMAGQAQLLTPTLTARCAEAFGRKRDGKIHLARAVGAIDKSGSILVRPSSGQGSHQLRCHADSNALVVLLDGEGASTGDQVDVLLLDLERLGPSPDVQVVTT